MMLCLILSLPILCSSQINESHLLWNLFQSKMPPSPPMITFDLMGSRAQEIKNEGNAKDNT